MTLLAVDKLSVAYGDLFAVREVSFTVDEGIGTRCEGVRSVGEDGLQDEQRREHEECCGEPGCMGPTAELGVDVAGCEVADAPDVADRSLRLLHLHLMQVIWRRMRPHADSDR